jgi:rRNA maturation endonuclease Nob1
MGTHEQDKVREFWAGRARKAVFGGWWRCARCFARVLIEEHGWVCCGCGVEIERCRRKYREENRV